MVSALTRFSGQPSATIRYEEGADLGAKVMETLGGSDFMTTKNAKAGLLSRVGSAVFGRKAAEAQQQAAPQNQPAPSVEDHHKPMPR